MYYKLVLIFSALLALQACGESRDGDFSVREVEPSGMPHRPELSSAERLGMRSPSATGDVAMMPDQAGTALFHYATPAGWSEIAPTQFRDPNFFIDGDPSAQCYVTVLSGEGGGIEANVNLWHDQVGRPHPTPAEIASLERIPFLGHSAPLVDIVGTFSGMDGTAQASPNWRLVGTMAPFEGQMVFVKMIGPDAVLAGQLQNFRQFCASLHSAAGHSHDHAPAPAAAPAYAPSAPTAAAAPAFDPTRLSWDQPEGWQRAADQPMRLVSFSAGADGQTECYVAVLGAGGGGTAANLNRWRGQMQLSPLSAQEIAALDQIEVLGRQAVLIEMEGTYVGMGNEPARPGYGMAGIVLELPTHALFVKMTGPAGDVAAEREALIAFCKSLSIE